MEYISQIESDLIGYISILLLRFADLKDPGCTECLKLAEFASQAVDYAKTGVAVEFTQLPRPPQPERPDFLSGEGSNRRLTDRFYRSQKILGILFRRVLIDEDTADRYEADLFPSDGITIWNSLRQIDDLDDIELLFPLRSSSNLIAEMKHLLEAYSDRLFVIAQTHSLSKYADSNLLEEEIVSGTIMAKWADHNKRREAVTAMDLQVSVPKWGQQYLSTFFCADSTAH